MNNQGKDPDDVPTTTEGKTSTPPASLSAPQMDNNKNSCALTQDTTAANRNELPTTVNATGQTLANSDSEEPTPSCSFTLSSVTSTETTNNIVAVGQRTEFSKLLMRLGEEGDGDANQIVMELLNSEKQADRPTSVIERVSESLMLALRTQTLAEAGIIPGNERYLSFLSVIQNYAKLYAARRFIEKLPMLGLPVQSTQETGQTQNQNRSENEKSLVRMVADEVLQIPELMRQLSASLEKMEFFNEDTAYKVYLEARRHPQAKILRELMLTRISRVYLCIVSSASFLDFSEQELIHVLNNCYISVNSEIEVFLSVVLWLEHNWYERKNCAERVLSGVRFGLMPTWYLFTLDRTNRCNHFARVVNNKGVQTLLENGIKEALALRSRNSRTADNNNDLKVPLPRDWVADPECRHHHKCHCERFMYPTYDVFKDYLARIIRLAPNYWKTLRPAQEVYRNVLTCCSPPFNAHARRET